MLSPCWLQGGSGVRAARAALRPRPTRCPSRRGAARLPACLAGESPRGGRPDCAAQSPDQDGSPRGPAAVSVQAVALRPAPRAPSRLTPVASCGAPQVPPAGRRVVTPRSAGRMLQVDGKMKYEAFGPWLKNMRLLTHLVSRVRGGTARGCRGPRARAARVRDGRALRDPGPPLIDARVTGE